MNDKCPFCGVGKRENLRTRIAELEDTVINLTKEVGWAIKTKIEKEHRIKQLEAVAEAAYNHYYLYSSETHYSLGKRLKAAGYLKD